MDKQQVTGDSRWLSYDEIADMRGIDRASAIRMVRRKQWTKQDANDGMTRVAVPETFFRAKRTKPNARGQVAPVVTGQPLSDPGQIAEVVTGQTPDTDAVLVDLRGQLTRAEALADRAEVGRLEAVTQLRQAEAEREAARIAAASAEGEIRGLREALAEARRPFWRRWIS